MNPQIWRFRRKFLILPSRGMATLSPLLLLLHSSSQNCMPSVGTSGLVGRETGEYDGSPSYQEVSRGWMHEFLRQIEINENFVSKV